ncbi:SusC/RagA family TonB-linked outer membrane protein [Xanthomarina gelatinilytica]|uniref:SusC/RagA family TonB-linked outer membrane protein n=1 Tax=Xanthomarina gelatinilytica TaxID=1137281 RepID=UPI003AA8AAD4
MNKSYTGSYCLAFRFFLFLCIYTVSPAFAQDFSPPLVTGQVSDANGPLAGANVLIKGTAQGTTANLEGKYSIRANANDTLIFTYLGYVPKTEAINNRRIINVVLQEDAQALDAVVINAGYYKVSDREKTGSIARVTAKEIENQPVSNPLAAMQGRMPGVSIVQNTGVPGGGFSVRIRGRNSIRADGSEPLYIVDGVPYPSQSLGNFEVSTVLGDAQSPLNGINPNDIESIEVLKDADATAIYGSRGANGVVLITTKKGKEGKTRFNVSSTTGVGVISRRMDLLNTEQYLSMRREAFANDGITEYPAYAYDINGVWDQQRYTDWQQVLLGGTANYSTVNASVQGGDAYNSFLISGNHRKETTVFPGDFKYNKSSVLANINHTSKDDRVAVRFAANYVVDDNNMSTTSMVYAALSLPPNAPALYDETGALNWENSTFQNPLAALEGKYHSQTNTLLGSGSISYKLIKNLTLKSNLGYSNIALEENSTSPNTIYDPAYGLDSSFSSISVNNSERKSWIVEPQLEFKRDIGKAGISTLIGTTFQSETIKTLYQYAYDFTSNNLIYDIGSAAYVDILASSKEEYRYNAVYGRVNLNWDKKYLLNLTGRRDGSSRFGPGKRFANFGALGVAWIFSEEKGIAKALPFLSFGKLRGSYGSSGNDQIGNYGYLDTYQGNGLSYQGIPTLQPTRLFNPSYGWETNRKLEAALELGFLENRLLINAAYYRNRSSNQLVGIPLPATTGFPTLQGNLDATVQNTGLELELNTINIKNDNIHWNTTLNFSRPRNELISFPNLEGSTYANQFVVGEPLDIVLQYNYLGVDPQTGLYTFQDYNNNGEISSPDDKKKVTRLGVDYFGGLGNSLRYKNFTVDVLFQFVKQTGYNYLYTSALAGDMVNQPIEVLDHWQGPGNTPNTQQYSAGFNSEAYRAYGRLLGSNATVSDASYVRLKNIALSFKLPLKSELGLACRVFAQGQNLLTITDFEGMDPETSAQQLPSLRQISAGVEIQF